MNTMKRLNVLLLALTAAASGSLSAQDPLSAAKDLDASAAYEDALSALARIKDGRPDLAQQVDQYRAFSLFALGRTAEAEAVVETVIRRDPMVKPDSRESVANGLKNLGDGDRPTAPIEVRIDGKEETVASLYLARLEDAHGSGAGLICHVIDLTEQKRLEAQFAGLAIAVGAFRGKAAGDLPGLERALDRRIADCVRQAGPSKLRIAGPPANLAAPVTGELVAGQGVQLVRNAEVRSIGPDEECADDRGPAAGRPVPDSR